jgi:tetratricopeptide (TPR) repeat protein
MTKTRTPADQRAEAAKRRVEIARSAAGDLPRAFALAARAKADGLADPLTHYVLATQLKGQSRFEDAIAEAGLGLELDPRDARLMVLVGFCLIELGRRREAAQVLGVAVKLAPDYAEASYGYGWAAERLGALESAESGFKRAIALDPGHADALAGLSGLAARRRDWPVARDYAERAAALAPHQTDALMNLARIDLGESRFEAAGQRLHTIIALPYLKPLARANARLMLGDALDGAGRYQDAFEAYAEGKAELREQFAAAHGQPGTPAPIASVERILAEFLDCAPQCWPAARGAQPDDVRRGHAFLIGFPRSGTTLLEQVLATHPDVVTLEERPVLIDAEAEFLTEPGGIGRLASLDDEALAPYRRAYWARVREFGVDPHDKVFVDKHPLSTIRLPLLAKVFPDAKIIFAMRDPRDVVLSCFRRGFNMNPAMYQFTALESAARYYDAVMRAGQIYMRQLPITPHRIRYEDLVADFETTARALCDALGLEWTERLKDFAETAQARAIATPSSTQVGRGLYDEGVGQWRRYAWALQPVMPILQPWIETFGYSGD